MRLNGIGMGVLFIVCFVLMYAGQTIYDAHENDTTSYNIYNFTETNLRWNINLTGETQDTLSEKTGLEYEHLLQRRIVNMLRATIEWMGTLMMEVGKFFIEFGFYHPDVDFYFWAHLLLWWLGALIIIALVPLLVPISILVYLAFLGIRRIYRWWKKRMEERQTREVRE